MSRFLATIRWSKYTRPSSGAEPDVLLADEYLRVRLVVAVVVFFFFAAFQRILLARALREKERNDGLLVGERPAERLFELIRHSGPEPNRLLCVLLVVAVAAELVFRLLDNGTQLGRGRRKRLPK